MMLIFDGKWNDGKKEFEDKSSKSEDRSLFFSSVSGLLSVLFDI